MLAVEWTAVMVVDGGDDCGSREGGRVDGRDRSGDGREGNGGEGDGECQKVKKN